MDGPNGADADHPSEASSQAVPGRHDRQARFAPFGADGQRRLRGAHALVVGVGALGTHIAQTLARAGIGRLTLVDRDVVDLSNLQRQVLFDESDAVAGTPKASAAAAAIRRIDPGVEVVALDTEFDAAAWNALDRRPDLILDGTDNFATRFTLNELAVEHGLPWIHGAAVGSEGRAQVIRPGVDPCLRCLLPAIPDEGPNCDTLGVLAPAVAHVAAFQATEALKLLGGRDQAVTRGMFVLDVWAGRFDLLFQDAEPRSDCPACGSGRELAPSAPDTDARATSGTPEAPAATTSLCGRDAVQVRPSQHQHIDLEALARSARGDGHAVEELGGRALRIRVGELRCTVFPDARTLVFGTSEPDRALAVHRGLLDALQRSSQP